LLIAAAVAGVADTALAQGILRGMAAVSAGMIAAVGIKLVAALKNNPMGMWTCVAISALTFLAIGIFRWPLAWVILSLGSLASVWASHCIKQRAAA
jgi:chromate transporter